jgi:hypothetical protein
MCVCMREVERREREYICVFMCVCLCVTERGGERNSEKVCVRERERETKDGEIVKKCVCVGERGIKRERKGMER